MSVLSYMEEKSKMDDMTLKPTNMQEDKRCNSLLYCKFKDILIDLNKGESPNYK